MVALTSLILIATWVVSIARAAVMPLRQSDGVVVETRDGIAENFEDASGNYVTLEADIFHYIETFYNRTRLP
jgi:hypothetical protein